MLHRQNERRDAFVYGVGCTDQHLAPIRGVRLSPREFCSLKPVNDAGDCAGRKPLRPGKRTRTNWPTKDNLLEAFQIGTAYS
jgi:hypothetical protein